MDSKSPGQADRRRRRTTAVIKQSLRALRVQLTFLNVRVGAQLDLKDVDLDCLDLLASRGPLSPSALARHARLHPATVTGILDRLEQGGWVARARDPSDRRAVVVRVRPERITELLRLYAGMNSSMDEICASYDEDQLQVIADFLGRTMSAGRTAAEELKGT